MMRWVICAVLSCGLILPAWADNEHGLGSSQREMQAWFHDSLQQWVSTGCTPAVPASSLVLAPFPCDVYIRDITTGELIFTRQSAQGFAVPDSADVYLAISRDRYNTYAGWSRVPGSHYLYQAIADRPSDVSGLMVFAKVIVAGSVITRIEPIGNRCAQYGKTSSACFGLEETSSVADWQTAIDSVRDNGGGNLLVECGDYALDPTNGPLIIKKAVRFEGVNGGTSGGSCVTFRCTVSAGAGSICVQIGDRSGAEEDQNRVAMGTGNFIVNASKNTDIGLNVWGIVDTKIQNIHVRDARVTGVQFRKMQNSHVATIGVAEAGVQCYVITEQTNNNLFTDLNCKCKESCRHFMRYDDNIIPPATGNVSRINTFVGFLAEGQEGCQDGDAGLWFGSAEDVTFINANMHLESGQSCQNKSLILIQQGSTNWDLDRINFCGGNYDARDNDGQEDVTAVIRGIDLAGGKNSEVTFSCGARFEKYDVLVRSENNLRVDIRAANVQSNTKPIYQADGSRTKDQIVKNDAQWVENRISEDNCYTVQQRNVQSGYSTALHCDGTMRFGPGDDTTDTTLGRRASGVLSVTEGQLIGRLGANIAAAQTITIGDEEYYDIVGGTGPIQCIGGGGCSPRQINRRIFLHTPTSVTFTHNATCGSADRFRLRGANDYTTTTDGGIELRCTSSETWVQD